MNPDPNFYRVVAVVKPEYIGDLVMVLVTLENMKGEKQEKNIVFNTITSAWDFYNTQKKMLETNKNKLEK